MKAPDLNKLEDALGHNFRDRSLLELAITHSSFARELESQHAAKGEEVNIGDNEQLEFLGDAVLGLVTSQELYQRFPKFQEGQLSKLRAYLVSEKHLIVAAKRLKIGRYLRLGRGEEMSGGRNKTALQVDSLEALMGAMYLDSDLETPRKFILDKIIGAEIRKLGRRKADTPLPVTDYKSALQESAHAAGFVQPAYAVVREQGPQHNKTFTIEVRLRRTDKNRAEYVAQADGTTKKKGEQAAAEAALKYVKSLKEPSSSRRSRKGVTRES
ncbi:MAG TPA: ribonuclease III [Terriglobales bacterium]|nr:ribonuclease III [Terriglobales bacterium]